MEKRKVLIFGSVTEMSDFAFKQWEDIGRKAIQAKGIFTVALSGGKTPLPLYQRLAYSSLPWEKIYIFWVDERFVSFQDFESNCRIIKENLLNTVNIRRDNLHYIYIRETAKISAQSYEKDIRKFFNIKEGEFPIFDLIILGIGEDGHTASLFPGDNALQEKQHLTAAVYHKGIRYQRITFTLTVINNAYNIIFLVAGSNKSKAVKQILEENCPHLPASLVRPERGNLFFFLDREAASLLRDFPAEAGGGYSEETWPALCRVRPCDTLQSHPRGIKTA